MEIVKAKASPKALTNKTTYMSDEAFAALWKALKTALAFEQGKRRMHVTEFEPCA